MIGLLQRVNAASVNLAGDCIAEIDTGLLVLIGVERDDDIAKAERLTDRLLGYRVFSDDHGRMNRSLRQIDGGLLLVPQFTLAADTKKGTRPGFSSAAAPELGERLFRHLCEYANSHHNRVGSGLFGADMQVSLVNDGPVTFWLQV